MKVAVFQSRYRSSMPYRDRRDVTIARSSQDHQLGQPMTSFPDQADQGIILSLETWSRSDLLRLGLRRGVSRPSSPIKVGFPCVVLRTPASQARPKLVSSGAL